MIHVIRNACSTYITSLMYDRSIASNNWHFRFPFGSPLEDKHPKLDIVDIEIKEEFLSGVACSILLNVYDSGGKDYFIPEIFYCGVSIKDKFREDNIHTDDAAIKVLGILNPEWDEDWGGGFYYNGDIIKLSPGDFCIFDARLPHASAPIHTDKKRVAIDYSVRPINTQ